MRWSSNTCASVSIKTHWNLDGSYSRLNCLSLEFIVFLKIRNSNPAPGFVFHFLLQVELLTAFIQSHGGVPQAVEEFVLRPLKRDPAALPG